MDRVKLIAMSDALNDALELCDKFNFNSDQVFWFENAVINSSPVLKDGEYYISTNVYESLLKNFIVVC